MERAGKIGLAGAPSGRSLAGGLPSFPFLSSLAHFLFSLLAWYTLVRKHSLRSKMNQSESRFGTMLNNCCSQSPKDTKRPLRIIGSGFAVKGQNLKAFPLRQEFEKLFNALLPPPQCR